MQASVTVLSPIVRDMPFVGFAAVKGRIVATDRFHLALQGSLGWGHAFESSDGDANIYTVRRAARSPATACGDDCSSLVSASATYQLAMAGDGSGPAHMVIYGGSIVHRVGRHVKLLGEVTSAAGGAGASGDLENIEGVLVGYGVRFHTNAIAADVGFLKPVSAPTATTTTSCWACRSPACRTAGSNRLTRTDIYPAYSRPAALTGAAGRIIWGRSGPQMPRLLTNVVGFDDGPFVRERRGAPVLLVGAVCARTRLDGVVSGRIRKDGGDATARIVELVRGTQFDGHIRAVLLGGIAVGGFNVIDIHALAAELARPVLVVARRLPRLALIRQALEKLPRGAGKWRLIEQAGADGARGQRLRAARRPRHRRSPRAARGHHPARQHPGAAPPRPPDRGRHRHRQEPRPRVTGRRGDLVEGDMRLRSFLCAVAMAVCLLAGAGQAHAWAPPARVSASASARARSPTACR